MGLRKVLVLTLVLRGYLAALVAGTSLQAAHGLIETREGQTLEGDVQFEPGGIVISSTNGVTHRLELANLSRLRFQPPGRQMDSSSTRWLHGLHGIYFANTNLSGPGVERLDPTVDFNWHRQPAADGIGPDNFSVRWEGQIEPPVSEKFTFHLQVDGGARLWVDNQLLIDKWHDLASREWKALIDLEAEKRYEFRLDYFNHFASAVAKLTWSSPSTPRSVIPATRLHTPAFPNASEAAATNGLRALYFNEPDLTGPFLTRVDPAINFDWADGPPMSGLNPNRFSVRWIGKLVPKVSEPYTMHTVTDNGVRLWLNNTLLLDGWRDEALSMASTAVMLQAGEPYDLRMEMFDSGAQAMAKLYWSSPSTPRSIIPTSHLIPAPAPEPAPQAQSRKLPAGVVTVGGTLLAGKVSAADDTTLQFSEAGKNPSLSTVNVARILFQPLSSEAAAKLQPGRIGLLLKNQDFIDGEFRGLKEGRIKLSSILFGNKAYEVGQVLAAVLREVKPAPAQFEVRARDESLFRTDHLRCEKDSLLLQDSALSGRRLPVSEVVEIKAGR